MARYQIILAYDGTRYRGFQRQRDKVGERTVQGVFEAALSRLGWKGQTVFAAGRTDSGVHALGQVLAFDLDWNHSPDELRAALNAHLPKDVVAQSATVARPDFHPRYDASSRRYRYRVYCRAIPDPLRERYAWRVWPPVDVGSLKDVARSLPGTHDFAAFGNPLHAGGSTLRGIMAADWKTGCDTGMDELIFEITGQAFLYRMVRRLVFQQMSVGQGKGTPEQFREFINAPPRFPLQGLAPAQGLTLVEVLYPPEVLLDPEKESAKVR